MAAVVTVPARGSDIRTDDIAVPKANSYEIDDATGYLHLRTSTWGGDKIAVFQEWRHVVIEPDRGPDGRFVKRGS